MPEHDRFETRLGDAVHWYAGRATSGLDPVAFAHTVATARPRRESRTLALPWLTASALRLAWLLLLAALLVALAAGALFVGGTRAPQGWQRVDLPGGGAFADVAAGSGGYVAVGHDADGWAAFWFSSDCRHWTRASANGSSVDDITAVTTWGSGYAALGVGGVSTWASADGRVWRQLPAGSLDMFDEAGVRAGWADDLAGGPSGLVAVGYEDPYGGSPHAIWTSPDGTDWQLIHPLAGSAEGFFRGLNAVMAAGPGYVAVGEADEGLPIWSSPDGQNWTRVSSPSSSTPAAGAPTPAWSRLYWLTRGADGSLTVFGQDRNGYDTAWISRDGLTWTHETVSGLPDSDEGGAVWSVVATLSGYAAVGSMDPSGAEAWISADGTVATALPGPRAVMWSSTDGRSWTRMPGPPIGAGDHLHLALACGTDLLVSSGVGMYYESEPSSGTAMWLLQGGPAT